MALVGSEGKGVVNKDGVINVHLSQAIEIAVSTICIASHVVKHMSSH